MKVIKKIGNNAAICLDSKNRELVALGKGIGFPTCPYELEDIAKISRTFYGVDSNYLKLLNEIDESLFAISADIIDVATMHLEVDLSPNATFTLADHINFAIERLRKNMTFYYPIASDLEAFYEKEVSVAKYAVKKINKDLNIELPKTEMYGIVLNLINSEMQSSSTEQFKQSQDIIKDITEIIEQDQSIEIDKDSFNYSRFKTHVAYLIKRKGDKQAVNSENKELFNATLNSYPEVYKSAEHIKTYIYKKYDWILNDEELLYLMLHINRLCTREGCNKTA